MPSICGGLTANIEANCDTKPVGGVLPVIRVINRVDIASVQYDADNPLIVTGITLKAGKKAFTWEVFKRGHKPRFTTVKGDFSDNYRHEIETSVQTWDNATKAQVEGIIGGSFVVIAENVQNTGDARVEIYGLDAGLEAADGAVRNLAENQGVFVITLGSDDANLEPRMPRSFAVETAGVYDYSATIEALEGLDVAAPAQA